MMELGSDASAFLGAFVANILAGLWLAPKVRKLLQRVERIETTCEARHAPRACEHAHAPVLPALALAVCALSGFGLAACATPSSAATCARFIACEQSIAPDLGERAAKAFGEGSDCHRSASDERACLTACETGIAKLGATCAP